MQKKQLTSPRTPPVVKKRTTHMWDAPSRFDHNNNACHNKTTSLALLLAQKKNLFVERRNPKKERKKSIFMAALTMITDTKRAQTYAYVHQYNFNECISRIHNGTSEFLGETFRIDATTWIWITICKQIQPTKIGENNASARNGNGMPYCGKNVKNCS